ncbi:MAG: hypothetical protein LBH28_02330 [Oscillospiraceae bacterium]|jgi:hypothetical protein|nr:hypothetical protein [Oscillospiraceae bacterium]
MSGPESMSSEEMRHRYGKCQDLQWWAEECRKRLETAEELVANTDVEIAGAAALAKRTERVEKARAAYEAAKKAFHEYSHWAFPATAGTADEAEECNSPLP